MFNTLFYFVNYLGVKTISEINPIEDFVTMIKNKKEDLVETAVD